MSDNITLIVEPKDDGTHDLVLSVPKPLTDDLVIPAILLNAFVYHAGKGTPLSKQMVDEFLLSVRPDEDDG